MYLFMRGPGSLRSFNYVQSVGPDDQIGQQQQSSNDAANNDVTCADPRSWCKGSGKPKENSDLAATNESRAVTPGPGIGCV